MEQPKNYLVFFSTRQKLKLFTFVKSIEIREMVSFELGKEIEKDVFRLVTSVGQEKILSPHEGTFAHRGVCGSVVRASEHGIRSSEVRFLVGT